MPLILVLAASTCGRTEMDPSQRYADAASADDASDSGSCSEVPCLASLIPGCQPEGSCVRQVSLLIQTGTGTSSAEAYCFNNGIKVQLAKWAKYVDAGIGFDGGMTVKFKRRNAVCCDYVNYGGATSPNTVQQTYHDEKGEQVATATWDFPDDVITLTCQGGKPTRLSNRCRKLLGVDTSSCQDGTCVF